MRRKGPNSNYKQHISLLPFPVGYKERIFVEPLYYNKLTLDFLDIKTYRVKYDWQALELIFASLTDGACFAAGTWYKDVLTGGGNLCQVKYIKMSGTPRGTKFHGIKLNDMLEGGVKYYVFWRSGSNPRPTALRRASHCRCRESVRERRARAQDRAHRHIRDQRRRRA